MPLSSVPEVTMSLPNTMCFEPPALPASIAVFSSEIELTVVWARSVLPANKANNNPPQNKYLSIPGKESPLICIFKTIGAKTGTFEAPSSKTNGPIQAWIGPLNHRLVGLRPGLQLRQLVMSKVVLPARTG